MVQHISPKITLEIEKIISFSTSFQKFDFINVCKEGKLDKVVELINQIFMRITKMDFDRHVKMNILK